MRDRFGSAAALHLVNNLAGNAVPRHELLQFAAQVGSDVPFFFSGAPLALAWGRDGVRVCGVAPGPVLMPEGIAGNPDETALGRLGDPADVAHAVRYCIEAGFVTGQNIVVDGGRLLRP